MRFLIMLGIVASLTLGTAVFAISASQPVAPTSCIGCDCCVDCDCELCFEVCLCETVGCPECGPDCCQTGQCCDLPLEDAKVSLSHS